MSWEPDSPPASTLPVTEVTGETDGTCNFKSFTVEAPGAGAYYAGFWLLPTRYADDSYYNLSAWDSYISQNYRIKTTGISVCNFSSSRPKSYCYITARLSEKVVRPIGQTRSRGSNATAGLYGLSATEESVRIAVPSSTGGSFSIAASERIRKVSVYGLEGNRLGSVDCRESSADIPASSLNITRPGMYVVCVETADGVTSRKVVVNK